MPTDDALQCRPTARGGARRALVILANSPGRAPTRRYLCAGTASSGGYWPASSALGSQQQSAMWSRLARRRSRSPGSGSRPPGGKRSEVEEATSVFIILLFPRRPSSIRNAETKGRLEGKDRSPPGETRGGNVVRAQEHSGQASNLLINTAGQPGMEWNMSNPTDPYRNDQSRRFGVRGPDQAGFWPWLTAALTALGLLIGGTIGYNWGWGAHEKSAQSSPPTTTGSAPPQQRPAPPSVPNQSPR